ncbi:MAG TPA: ATP-binding protein [Dehalococcoidales bacterium]|nr:ATP-binding protein [Dehalococcoidales bacterium]
MSLEPWSIKEQPEFKSILQAILKKAVQILGGSAGVIAQWNETRQNYTISASHGLDPSAVRQLRPLMTGDYPNLPAIQEPFRLLSEPDSGRKPPVSEEVTSQNPIVVLPLRIGDVSTGLMFILHPLNAEAFANLDKPVLEAFAEQAAIALQNARLAHLLAEEKMRTEFILENSPDGIMSIDTQCRILGLNSAMEKMTGYSRHEITGRECSDVLHFRDFEGRAWCSQHCPMHQNDADQRHIIELQGKIRTKNARDLEVSIKYSLVLNQAGEPINAIATIRDISQLRQLENLRETFLSMLGHELQTPLAIIKGYASALTEGKWSEEVLKTSLNVIEEESDNLSRMVNRLLLASRVSRGGSPLNLELIDFPGLVEKVVRRRKVLTNQHVFQIQMQPDLPAVQADSQLIEEVLANLVDNAIKYSPQGGKITITGQRDNQKVKITVEDEGIGISEEGLKHLFERFYRVSQGPGYNIKGLGLGLYISKTIVEAHGGTIEASSQAGRGSRFTFSLPVPTTAGEAENKSEVT